ncbi:MAG: prolyl oligopeptidase family serine peptidase [Nonlabens sp.]
MSTNPNYEVVGFYLAFAKARLLTALLLCASALTFAQINLEYQKPPEEIMELFDFERPPSVLMDEDAENMILAYRDTYKSMDQLSEKELRLAGLRINPKTNIGSRTTFITRLEVAKVDGGEPRKISGLPAKAKISNLNWSPDYKMVAFTNTVSNGTEVWVLNVENASAKKMTPASVNANMGNPVSWMKDNSAFLVKMLPADRKPLIETGEVTPSGPTISVSDGSKAQNRTYQDLLKNPNDEQNFEQLARSEIKKVTMDGSISSFLPAGMYRSLSFSPDGTELMVREMKRPFSYIVTYGRFPYTVKIYDTNADLVKQVNEVPLMEEMPKGFMATREGKRSFSWRADQPKTLIYAEALDQGDPANEVDYRDAVYQIKSPYNGKPQEILKTVNRFSGIIWGDKKHAVAYDYWWNTRNRKIYHFNPSDLPAKPKVLYDLNYQDVYSDPGSFVTKRNKYGRSVLALEGNDAFLTGDGYTPEGQFPFVAELNLKDQKTERIYTSKIEGKKESLIDMIDVDDKSMLVQIESPIDYPNYYIRDLDSKKAPQQITDFENPFEALNGVHKEVLNYKRNDGLDLSGTLYLPADYDKDSGKKLPLLVWAYPREYKDKNSAGQNTQNPNEFIYPYYGSFVYWLTQGYAVLDDAAFPIVGEGEDEPNDTFIPQLVANGRAAIDAVDELGYIDRNRVGVGGHSYGAFMTANLLSHSDDFAAGIARSGAYNRTLTPFGFQSEERSYWDDPNIYNAMSPFMNAEKMDEPLLLIHGQADNNSGTYPLQSERYFNALKGLGATARLVMLPKESHGYAAKESLMHVLWEQHQWLEKYVKNREMEDNK